MSTYIQDVYCVLECLFTPATNKELSTSPILADVLFLAACYMMVVPELRFILRPRFIKKIVRVLLLVASIGVTSFLMMITTAGQARSVFCHYLKPVLQYITVEQKQILGFMLISFFIVFNVFLARSVKSTAQDMWSFVTDLKRNDPELPKIGDVTPSRTLRRVIQNKLQPLPGSWIKMTRNGTVYGK